MKYPQQFFNILVKLSNDLFEKFATNLLTLSKVVQILANNISGVFKEIFSRIHPLKSSKYSY